MLSSDLRITILFFLRNIGVNTDVNIVILFYNIDKNSIL